MIDRSAVATHSRLGHALAEPMTPITRPVDVFPLTYTQLRLLSECAAGIDARAEFLVDRGAVRLNPRGVEPPETEILVTSSDTGRRPLNTVALQVVAGDSISVGSTPLDLSFADAVFWSDASVQKFLFPYVASCGGHEAGDRLRRLQDAWNHYPQEQVTVYAIAHALPQAGVPLLLEHAIQVVYSLRDGSDTLRCVSLAEFLEAFPPVRAALDMEKEMPYWRGGPGLPPRFPDHTLLRKLAEYGASLCRGPGYFVLPSEGTDATFSGPHQYLLANLAEGDIVIPVFNPAVPKDRKQLQGVWFQPPAQAEMKNLSALPGTPGWNRSADALFWSTGAVEQFLYPYYASVGGFHGLEELANMARTWKLDTPVELGSDRKPIVLGDPDATGEMRVFGLIHMPTSEWTQVEGRVSAGTEVGVLAGSAHAGVKPYLAREFAAMHPRHRHHNGREA